MKLPRLLAMSAREMPFSGRFRPRKPIIANDAHNRFMIAGPSDDVQ
jgi:hypothetical protein